MSVVRYRCTNCLTEQDVEEPAFTARRRARAGLAHPCIDCGGDLYRTGEKVVGVATDSTRRSKRQEKRVAVREGGRRQPGSGARDGWEGDVRSVGKYRGECKFTRASSYNLKLADLRKLESQATSGELPVFDVEFQSESPARRYIIMPEWAYETLMQESGRREDAGHDSHHR